MLQVFDHDDHNNDDAMGKFEIDLQTLSVGTPVEMRCELQDVGKIVARGHINVILNLQVCSEV